MAKQFSLHLLLLASLVTAANLQLLSAAETPPPSQPLSSAATPPSYRPPKPSNRPHHHSHHRNRETPPLPPALSSQSPPPPPEIQENHLNPLRNIIDGLIGLSDFLGWDKLITSTDLSSIPLAATFFVPSNNATLNPGGVDFNPFLVLYHIVPQRLTFSDLQKLPPKARLPTLLPSNFIVITNNSASNFTVDDSQIVLPDAFSNAAFVLHGVGKTLDFSVYGGDGLLQPAGNTTAPSGRPPRNNPDYPGEMTSGGHKYRCNGFRVVSLILGYTCLPRIVHVDRVYWLISGSILESLCCLVSCVSTLHSYLVV